MICRARMAIRRVASAVLASMIGTPTGARQCAWGDDLWSTFDGRIDERQYRFRYFQHVAGTGLIAQAPAGLGHRHG